MCYLSLFFDGRTLSLFLLSFVFSLSHGEISALDTNKWLHNQDNCTVTVAGRCKPIDSQLKQSCLGTPLPYDFTSDGPIIDDVSHFDLQTWAALRAIPTCWVKLQIFLCTVYVPECQRLKGSSPTTAAAETVRVEYSQVVLPERGMCLAVRKACPLLFSGHGIGGRSLLGDSVPRFLQCDIYAPVCRQNKLRPKIFDANKAECQAPLMSTTNSRNWIKGIATCAFPCRSPIYRPEHYTLARNLIFAAAVAGILVNVCVLFTLRLIRSSTSFPRYGGGEGGTTLPMSTMSAAYRCLSHTALTFIHLAFLIGCLGLLIPHLPGVDDAVACRADGSVRVGEPQTQTGSPILCVICFMLVYIPMLAVALWSNVLDYAIFAAFHTAASLIVDTNFVGFTAIGSTPALRRRRLSGGVWRLQCWRYKHPALLLPPDSCELPKRRLRSGDSGGGVNEAMEGSVSPASPAVSTVATGGTKRRLSAIEMEEKAPQPRQPCSQNTTWKLSEGDRPEHQSLPLVCRLLYPTTPIGCALANHAEMGGGDVVVGQRATFNSIGSQITCIRIAAFAVPVVFALIGLTASEIDGEPLSGLCLVGIRTLWAYCAMVVAPLVLCLFLKVTYLSRAMRSIWQLRGYLVVASYAPVDREMAHRLTMCFRAYVIYILTLTALLTFSAGVHAYAYVEEPKWLETQRLFLFCQLRHRLMGLDGVAASSSCRTPFTTDICFFDSPLPNSLNATAAAAASTITSGLRVRREDHQIVSSSTSISSEEDVDASASGRPLAGPILLNLFTYLMSNLVFASMCLLDASVKHKWLSLLRRVISFLTACPKKSTGSKPFSPQMIVINKSTNFHLPATFSWWDPGIFFHDYEVVPVEEVKVSADNGSIAVAGGGGMAVTRTVATSDVSCGCNRRYSLSTNDGSWVMSSVGATNATSTIRGVGGNTSSVASSNAAATTAVAVAAAKPIHKSNSLTSSQSLFTAHRGHKPRSSAGGALFNPFSSIQREEEVAATLEHNLGRPIRRSRYRRMWSSKGLGRRRLVPRSYSTLGLAGGGSGGERRSLNSLLLHRAVSSPTNSSNGKCASGAGRGGHSQQDLSIGSLSRLCAAAAAMELERSRKILDGGSQIFGHAPRGSTAASWTRRGGTTSRLSLASSSGAESYNSFQLLAEQAGATWRELWRTRLLLIDALHWAQSAAAASATENPPPPPPQTSDQQQQQLIAATSMMMAYLMGQQQQQPVEVEASCGGEESTPDSVMMAALMAATAAAQAAMHQSGPPQQSAGASLLPPIPTLPTSPLKKMPHYEVPLATPAYPIPKGCQPDILADYNNLHHHLRSANTASTTGATVRAVRQDVVCHLDASAAAGVSSPPHLLHPAMQQLRSPWGPSHQPPPQPLSASGGGGVWSASTTSPGFTHFSLPVIPPYAFVPPPPPHIIPPPAIVNTSPNPERGDCVEGEEDEDDDGDDDLEEGSDAFNSEDEVMSTSGEEATETMGAAERRRLHRGGAEASAVDDYWDTFPTPEGQPSCAAAPPPPPDADADDVSSVSQSASQVVVATVHGEAAEVEADAASEKSLPKS